ncbi:MAG TPA: Uma2 family endonuclease [Pirellulales bacterium]|jgi:Uma2 family endonuclease|nr:Uma2 family endonuclease [Pirellulales bacterium]
MAIITEQCVPPLSAGDQLTREEFLRRWEADPSIKLAELIEGTVYMPSLVSVEHGSTDGDVGTWLGVYHAFTPGTASERNTTSFMLSDSPQPDLNLRLLAEYGGGSWVEDRFLHGRPELLAEVCVSTASYDLNQKFRLYQSAGVPEYLAVVVFEREIRWHVLVDGRYQLFLPDADGLHRSRLFPGLWLDGQALLAGNLRQVLDRLPEGLRSPEHDRFVGELAARRKTYQGAQARPR